MKDATPIQGALIGFSGGLAILVATLALEVYARGLPFQGGLLTLQLDSVAVWVLESLPVLLAGAAYVVMTPPPTIEAPPPPPTPPSAPPARALPPPPPSLPPSASSGRTAAPSSPPSGALPSAPMPSRPPSSGSSAPTGAGDPGTSSVRSTGGSGPMPAPPPVPAALKQSNLLGGQSPAAADHRVRALKELVKALKEAASHATKESHAKSELLSNLTQELRNPLAQIVGVTEAMADEARNPAQSARALEPELRRVASAGRELVGLINDILDLSRIEVGQLAMVLEDIDMAQIIEEVRASVEPGSDSHLGIHLDPAARMARGDHMRVRQILVTLVNGAVEVSAGGPVTVTIERGAEGRVEVRVRDSGPPMSKAQIDRLLERRSTATLGRPSDERRGLGLAVARRLAELMQGGLEGHAEGSRGTEFMLVLPPASIAPDQVRPRSTIALNERLSGMRLVLLDAEPASRALAQYLTKAGVAVDHVPDVQRARRACQPDLPELAVVDVGLADAWNLVEEMLQRGIAVVATSMRDEDVEPALQRGVTAFLVRPVDRKLALATLERCLDD